MDRRSPYSSIRQPILAANCVSTSQPLAAQAGLAMLARGGNAVDAAIATAVALTVVEPVTNGIGSDAFAIVALGGALVGLNASGRSPAGQTEARFAKMRSMPATGWDSATVPGAVAAQMALHKRFGHLPFQTPFEPAIGYARQGFLVSPVVAQLWLRQVATLGGYREFTRVFLPQGRAPAAGELFRCPGHAETLEAIATSEGRAFYRGAIAEAIAVAAAQAGHVGLRPGLVDEHQAPRIDAALIGPPSLAVAAYVRAVLLTRDEGLFLKVTPRRRKKRLIIEVSALTQRSDQRRSQSA